MFAPVSRRRRRQGRARGRPGVRASRATRAGATALPLLVALAACGSSGLGAGSRQGSLTSPRLTSSPPPSTGAAAPRPTAASGSASTATGSATAASRAAPDVAPSGALIPGGPVPVGFQATDLSFTSVTDGWALGTAPCSASPCTSLLHTTDSGAHWSGGHAPSAALFATRACESAPSCVTHVRFASQQVGYAYGWGLYMTTDSGLTWAQVPGPDVLALEPVSGGDVLRVVSTSRGCPPGCNFLIQSAPVGSTSWRTLDAPSVTGDGVRIVRAGPDRTDVLIFGNPAGGAGTAHTSIVGTADGGRTWSQSGDPCGAPDGNEADAVDAAAAGSTVSVLCRSRMNPQDAFVISSTNGAFGTPHQLPASGVASTLALSPAGLLAVPTFDGATPSWTVQTSSNGGASWAAGLTTSAADALESGGGIASAAGFIGFETSAVGRFAPGPTRLFTTNDGGRSWTAQPY